MDQSQKSTFSREAVARLLAGHRESRVASPAIKTAVIGASGYVGRHLWKAYCQSHPGSLGTSFSSSAPGLTSFDIRQPDIQLLQLEEKGYRAVLIASAKPNIAFCENERDAAYSVNVRGMLNLIRQIGKTSLQVIFLSSDYVFEGNTGPYDDCSAARPTTEYGRQKALVEKEIPSLSSNYLILRLSKIYGVQKADKTLLDDIACDLTNGRHVRAANDQVFCPTLVDDLILAITSIQRLNLRGVINVCSPERWSRHAIAVELGRALEVDLGLIKPVSLHEIPGMSGRPLDTSMICSRLVQEVGTSFTPLCDSIMQVVANWKHR